MSERVPCTQSERQVVSRMAGTWLSFLLADGGPGSPLFLPAAAAVLMKMPRWGNRIVPEPWARRYLGHIYRTTLYEIGCGIILAHTLA